MHCSNVAVASGCLLSTFVGPNVGGSNLLFGFRGLMVDLLMCSL